MHKCLPRDANHSAVFAVVRSPSVRLRLFVMLYIETANFTIKLFHRLVALSFYTVAIKACHFVFDNNSGVSWSIFILSVPVETERNTLQFTYLMA